LIVKEKEFRFDYIKQRKDVQEEQNFENNDISLKRFSRLMSKLR